MDQIGKIMLLFIMILGLTACESEGSADAEWYQSTVAAAEDEILFQTYELLQSEDPENENLAGMLQEQAAGAMVRISAGSLMGSGVIFHMDQKGMVILTAAHVLEDVKIGEGGLVATGTELLEIELADGTVLSDKNNDKSKDEGGSWSVILSQTSDLGIITVPVEQITKEVFANCRYVPTDKEAFDALKVGDMILVMGSAKEVAGNAYEGTLTEPWIYLEDYEQYMMLGHTYAQPGMSGGGVFDRHGRFIGILSGADAKGDLAVVPLSIILSEM